MYFYEPFRQILDDSPRKKFSIITYFFRMVVKQYHRFWFSVCMLLACSSGRCKTPQRCILDKSITACRENRMLLSVRKYSYLCSKFKVLLLVL